MMKKLAIIFAGLAISTAAAAQGFNPVVEVTNAYKGKLMEVHKQEFQMAVPDTLLKFDYDFDYSTFENPYKGAYDFSPYRMNMTPEPRMVDGRNLFVKAGAGYTFNPEALIVWNPTLKGKVGDRLNLGFMNDFNGYWGQYHNFVLENRGDWDVVKKSGSHTDGHDADNTFRVNAALDAKKAVLSASLGWDMVDSDYEGLRRTEYSDETYYGNSWNAFGATLGVRSKGHGKTFADFNIGYRFGNSESSFFSSYSGTENYVSVNARVGSKLERSGSSAYVDIDLENENYNDKNLTTPSETSDFKTNLFLFSATPTISGHGDRFNYSAGLKLSMISRSIKPDAVMSVGKGHIFYPQLHVDYAVVKDALKVYADFGGGDRVDTYGSLISRYHFLTPVHQNSVPDMGMEHVIDVYNFKAGVSGRIHARFQYDIESGVGRVNNAVNDALPFHGMYAYHSRGNVFNAYYKASGAWLSEAWDVKADFKYLYTEALDNYSMLLPSSFSGGFSATWNWKQRIFLGAAMDAASHRKVSNYEEDLTMGLGLIKPKQIPGYIDLGVNGEFKLSRNISVWAKGGNLLGNAIHKEVLFARRGVYFTAGLCVNL